MVHAGNTDGHSQVCANTSRLNKGAFCEEHVCRALLSQGFRILERNFRTPFAQVDILALNPRTKTLGLIEVKYARLSLSADQLVSRRQKQRLRRAHQWFVQIERTYQVRSILAVVDRTRRITWFCDFLS